MSCCCWSLSNYFYIKWICSEQNIGDIEIDWVSKLLATEIISLWKILWMKRVKGYTENKLCLQANRKCLQCYWTTHPPPILLSIKEAHLPECKSVRPSFNYWDKIKYKKSHTIPNRPFYPLVMDMAIIISIRGILLFRPKDPHSSGNLWWNVAMLIIIVWKMGLCFQCWSTTQLIISVPVQLCCSWPDCLFFFSHSVKRMKHQPKYLSIAYLSLSRTEKDCVLLLKAPLFLNYFFFFNPNNSSTINS